MSLSLSVFIRRTHFSTTFRHAKVSFVQATYLHTQQANKYVLISYPFVALCLGVARTVMTRRCAFVTARLPRNGAGLRALSVGLTALPGMTQFQAMVPAAGEVPTAGTTTGKTLQVAEDALAKLVFAIAVLRCQLRAWWARLVAIKSRCGH